MKFYRILFLTAVVFISGLLTTSCYTQLAVAKHHDRYYEDEYVDQAQDSVYYDEGTVVNNYYYYGRPDRFLMRSGMYYDDPFYWDNFYFGASFYFGDYYGYPYWYDPFLYYPGVVVGIFYPPYYRYYDPWWSGPPVVYSPPFKHRPFRQNGRSFGSGNTRRVSLNKRGGSGSAAANSSTVTRTGVRRSDDRTDNNWGSGSLVTRRSSAPSANGSATTVSSRRTSVRGNDRSTVRVQKGDYQRRSVRRRAKKEGNFRRSKVKKNRRVYYPVHNVKPVKRLHPAKTGNRKVRTVRNPKPVKESSKKKSDSKPVYRRSESSSNSGSSYRPAPSRSSSFRSTPARSSSFSGSRSSTSRRSSSGRVSRSSHRR